MKKCLLVLSIMFSMLVGVSAQVFNYVNIPQHSPIIMHYLHTGIVYNQTGVAISAKLDVQVYDKDDILVYHRQSPAVTFQPGKTDVYDIYYGSTKPIVNKGIKPSTFLLNHKIKYSLLHPIDMNSVISRYEIFTKNYGPQNGFNYDPNRDFKCEPMSLEIASREHYFHDEGIMLKHEITLPKATEQDLSHGDVSIDIWKSKVYLIKDNGGKDYISQNMNVQAERNDYIMDQARKGTFIINPNEYKLLSLPILPEREKLATFDVRAFSIPIMATHINTEGSIVLLEHTEELITESIDVKLGSGKLSTIHGSRIDWDVNGRGMCEEGSYELISPRTALKIKSIRILNPMVDFCGDSGSSSIQVNKTKLPYDAKLEITYHKPIVREIFFQNYFNLSFDNKYVRIETDHFTDQSIAKISIAQDSRWVDNGINVEFPIESGKPGFNAFRSSVEITNEKGKKVELGNLKLNRGGSFDNVSVELNIEKMPASGTRFLTANLNLAMETDLIETEDFMFTVDDFDNLPIQEIDGLPISISKNGRDMYSLGMQVENSYFGGIPNRTVTQVQVLGENGVDVIGTFENRYNFTLPDAGNNYKVKVTVNKKKTEFKKLKKKIAIGSVIPSNDREKIDNPEHAAIVQRNKERMKLQKVPVEKKETKVEKDIQSTADEVKNFAEVLPMFPGCESIENYDERRSCSNEKLQEYVYSHEAYLNVANEAKSNKAIVKFVVEKDGTLSNVSLMRTSGAINDALKTIFNGMKDEKLLWHPGIDKGEKVRVQFMLPIKY